MSKQRRILLRLKKREDASAVASVREKDSLVYGRDWDEDECLEEWCGVLRQTTDLPPMLQVIVSLDASNDLAVVQHARGLGC